MKLRLDQKQIRLRLEPDEVERFALDGRLEETVDFGHGLKFSFELAIGPIFGALLNGNRLTVNIEPEAAANWTSSEEIGVDGFQKNGTDAGLNILVEKDLGRRKPRFS